jgi:hypothetical protein
MSLHVDTARAEFEFEYPNESVIGLQPLLEHIQKIINIKDSFHSLYTQFIDDGGNVIPDSPHTNKQLKKDSDGKLRFYFPLRLGSDNDNTVESLYSEFQRWKDEQETEHALVFDLLIGLPIVKSDS